MNKISGITIYEELPVGWDILWGAVTAPQGYIFIWNKKSRFTGEYKCGLISVEKVR